MTKYRLDHVSIGVANAQASLQYLCEELGATPIAGERLPTFRYVLTRLGDGARGMQVELIEPQGGPETFMRRFIEQHGESVHHLTFTVPDVETTIRKVRDAGFRVVQMHLEYPPWREAFIFPTEPGVGVVIQLADTDRDYPPIVELLAAPVRDPEAIPHNRGGQDRYWWRPFREASIAPRTVFLERIDFVSDDIERMKALLTGPLGGVEGDGPDGRIDIAWGESVLSLTSGDQSGVRMLVCSGLPAGGRDIGSVALRNEGEVD